jgi:hypothetical protein
VNKSRDALPSPATLLEGYHVAGWICFAMALICLPLNFYSLRGLGVIGGMGNKSEGENKKRAAITAGDERGISRMEMGVKKEKSVGFQG